MNSLRRGLFLWTVVCSLETAARAEIILSDRFSEIWYNTVNLTDDVPPATQMSGTTDLYSPFSQSLVVEFDYFTIIGHHNTANVYVFQNSNVSTTAVYVDTVQNGATTTDFDSPAIYTRSNFRLDFYVANPTPVTITGLIEGSSNPAHADFARVQLIEDFGPMFSTSFTDFPFVGMLTPGHNYQLQVESRGFAQINGVTSSRALASIEFGPPVPEPTSVGLLIGGLIIACSTQRWRAA
jgi:hypothetical protein